MGRVGDAHRLHRLVRAPHFPTPIPRRHRAIRRDVCGVDLLPAVVTSERQLPMKRVLFRNSFVSRLAAPITSLVAASVPLSAYAAPGTLPTLEDPSRGQGTGILQTLQNYGYRITLLGALLVITSMFIGVAYHA